MAAVGSMSVTDPIHGGDFETGLARLTVDLRALRENYRRVAEVGNRTAAVVKANGYGLGAVRVVEALVREGCRDFFVATQAEGVAVRGATRDSNIFVFSGPVDARSAAAMVRDGLTPVLNDETQLERWGYTGKRRWPYTSIRECTDSGSTMEPFRRRCSMGSTSAWCFPTSPARMIRPTR